MPKFVIERELPGAGRLTDDQWREIAQRSNEVLDGLAGRAQWLESFVTDDKLFCIYIADDVDTVWDHATGGDFPCTQVHTVRRVIDPTTGAL